MVEETKIKDLTAKTTVVSADEFVINADGDLDRKITRSDVIESAAITMDDVLLTVKDNKFKINSPDDADGVTFVNSNQTANRNLTIPILGGNDTLPTLGVANDFTANQTVVAALPRWLLEESDQASNTKKWGMESDGSTFSICAINDAESTKIKAIQISRDSGSNEIDTIKLKTAAGTARITIADTVVTIGSGTEIDMGGSNLINGGTIFLTEQAEADADVEGKGQIWVDLATPNKLFFTDDAGTDFDLTAAASLTPWVADIDGDGFNLTDAGVIFLREQAEADADVAAAGQIWVNTATPNQLFFTGDTGVDEEIAMLNGAQTFADIITFTAKPVFSTALTILGTIATGVWEGTVVASAFLDTDTMHLGVAQAITADKTFNDSVNATFGTGGDADIDYDGTNLVINTSVAGTGELTVVGGAISIDATERVYFDAIGDTFIQEQSADDLEIQVGGEIGLKLEEIGTEINVVLGAANALATTATDGFLYLPTMARVKNHPPDFLQGLKF